MIWKVYDYCRCIYVIEFYIYFVKDNINFCNVFKLKMRLYCICNNFDGWWYRYIFCRYFIIKMFLFNGVFVKSVFILLFVGVVINIIWFCFWFKDIMKISIIFYRVNVKFSDMYIFIVIVDFLNCRMLLVKCLWFGYV